MTHHTIVTILVMAGISSVIIGMPLACLYADAKQPSLRFTWIFTFLLLGGLLFGAADYIEEVYK